MESAKLIADLTVYFVEVVKRIVSATALLGLEYDAASLEEYVAMEMRVLGAVVAESACRHVVASRLKGPGMRWDETGAEAILHLRTLELSGRWDAFWERDRAA